MENVLLVAYLLIVLAMIVVILLQRSEGGALGIGGGGGGGFMTARGSANLLTRTTAILATLFFITAIGLTVLSELDRGTSSILDRAGAGADGEPGTVLDALDALQGDSGSLPVPTDGTQTTAPSSLDALDLAVPELPANDETPVDDVTTDEGAPTSATEPAVTEEAPAPTDTTDGAADLAVPDAPADEPTPAAPAGN
jgi:preprotein translocase subunit SecG